MRMRILFIFIISAAILGSCASGGNIQFGDTGSLSSDADNPLLLAVSKYYAPSASVTPSGVITWTLTMSDELATAPVMTVEDTAALGEVPCSLGEDPRIVTCSYENISTCRTLKDYAFVISGGATEEGGVHDSVTLYSNAADDEFDAADSIDDCWNFGGSELATYTIANSELQIDAFAWPADTEMQQANITKTPLIIDFAIILHIADISRPETLPVDSFTGAGIGTSGGDFGDDLVDGYHILLNGFAGTGAPEPLGFIGAVITKTDDGNFTFYTPDGSWGTDLSLYTYMCIVRYGGIRSLYASVEDKNFAHFFSDNTIMQDAADENDPTPLDYDFVGYETYPLSVQIFTYDPGLLEDYSPKYDFVRFRSSGITGTAADCNVSLLP